MSVEHGITVGIAIWEPEHGPVRGTARRFAATWRGAVYRRPVQRTPPVHGMRMTNHQHCPLSI
jgi:hypothetical protein